MNSKTAEIPTGCKVIPNSSRRFPLLSLFTDSFFILAARKSYDLNINSQREMQGILKAGFRELQRNSVLGNEVLPGLKFSNRVYTSQVEASLNDPRSRVVVTTTDFVGPFPEEQFVYGGMFSIQTESRQIRMESRSLNFKIIGLVLNTDYKGYLNTRVLRQISLACATAYNSRLFHEDSGTAIHFPHQQNLDKALKFVHYKI